MCYSLVQYTEWACGWRQSRGRQEVDCHRTVCRLSTNHTAAPHDCQQRCEGVQREEHHLIMTQSSDVCEFCEEAGRGPHEHPGLNYRNGPAFQYVVANYRT
ncbi:hypothetical protein BD310DRAFT_873391 [Dichomitus squalens]|uniref:Uncharacterized protein n=1 Tax=Dichomitus squalens TaxID=114155 RepID=A0A4Q9Q2X6_9APHY|nr:hypothetical protein BD310DRAFT_873391 [Dichomitus squalens]